MTPVRPLVSTKHDATAAVAAASDTRSSLNPTSILSSPIGILEETSRRARDRGHRVEGAEGDDNS